MLESVVRSRSFEVFDADHGCYHPMPQHPKTEPKHWKLEDVFDFDYHRRLDQGEATQDLEDRDRKIYKREGRDGIDPRELLLRWLYAVREIRALKPAPGDLFLKGYELLMLIVCIVSIASGVSATLVALRYDGSVPVNVSLFLGLIVAPQILLLAGYFLVMAATVASPRLIAVLYAIPARFGASLLKQFWAQAAKRAWLGAEQRDRWTIAFSNYGEIIQEHGGLVANRVFRLIQVAGVLFNVSVVASMAILLSVTDRAFGWQSSLVDSPERVDAIVHVVSAPWCLFVGNEAGRPSFEEIVGSRIVLRESGAPLASGDLLSWWPFLLWCVVFYGLTPRMFAWLFSLWNESRLLKHLNFDGFGYRILVERMRSIEFHSEGIGSVNSGDTRMPGDLIDMSGPDVRRAGGVAVYVLAGTLARYQEESLKHLIGRRLNQMSLQLHVLEKLDGAFTSSPVGSELILLILEGWQAPIQETLNQLRSIANTLQTRDEQMVLVLIGKPSSEGVRPLADSMRQVWKSKIQLLKCANLRVDIPEPL